MPDLPEPAHPGGGGGVSAELKVPDVESARHVVPAPEPSAEALGTRHVAPSPPLLLFEHVSKWYGPVLGVNQVTLELRSGITGLVGANGAGKSTLLRLAAGQLRPDLGRVSIKGVDAWGATARMLTGYCPEIDAFYEEMSGRQFVTTMARLC